MGTVRMEPELVTDEGLRAILAVLKQRETERWTMTDEQVREAAPQTYLLTYTLRQGDRVTRRLTVWQGSAQSGWKVLYHQGTIVS